MAASSRRSFLALAGAGAAGAGLAGAVGSLPIGGIAVGPSDPAVPPVAPDLTGALVAYVEDIQGDSVSVLIGDQEVVIRDKKLVARLAAKLAAASAT